MPTQQFQPITPTPFTHYLCGDSGPVWFEPDYGEPVILAANTSEDRRNVADFVWGCLHLGIAIHGVPSDHHVSVSMFGGDRMKGFHWVQHEMVVDAPDSATPAIIVMPDKQTFAGLQKITATAVAFHGSTETEQDKAAIVKLIEEYGDCATATAQAHLERFLDGDAQDRRGGGGRGAGRKSVTND